MIVALPGLFSYLFLRLWNSLDFSLTLFFFYSNKQHALSLTFKETMSVHNGNDIAEDTKKMTQPGSTVLPRHKKKDEEQIMTKQTPHMKQAKKKCAKVHLNVSNDCNYGVSTAYE